MVPYKESGGRGIITAIFLLTKEGIVSVDDSLQMTPFIFIICGCNIILVQSHLQVVLRDSIVPS
jgi:hypothetical protein